MTIKTIAIFNHKGGVGKTTTAVNLAACLAKVHGRRLLVVDLDPQANATRALLANEPNEKDPTVKDWLLGSLSAAPVRETRVPGLCLIPADLTLSETSFGLARGTDGSLPLRTALSGIAENHDFILVDCPPSLGPLALSALAAADAVIVPCETQYLALRGLAHVVDLVDLVKGKLNPRLRILGVLATKFHILSLANNEVLRHLRDNSRVSVFRTVVPRDVRTEEAPSHGLPLILYAPESRATRAYLDLAKEVTELCQD